MKKDLSDFIELCNDACYELLGADMFVRKNTKTKMNNKWNISHF